MTDSINKRWVIINDILTRDGVAKQHLTSFDEFLKKGLQEIIDEINHIDIENAEYPYKIQLGRIQFKQPRMMELDGSVTHITPAEARMRNVSYIAPLMLEANVIEDGKTLETRFIHIGDVPVMVKSDACILRNFTEQKLIDHAEDPYDPGGYFIINGSERVIVGLEDLSYNKIIVDAEKVGGKKVFKAKVYSSIVGYRAKLELVLKEDGLVVARIPGSPVDIPVVTLMRALGLESDKEIASAVSMVDEIQNELESSFEKTDVTTADFMSGLTYDFKSFYITYALIKTFVFAFIVSSVSSYFGYHAKGGAIAVGKSSTKAVVYSSILILIFNYEI